MKALEKSNEVPLETPLAAPTTINPELINQLQKRQRSLLDSAENLEVIQARCILKTQYFLTHFSFRNN
jgi:hypothetical protein